MPHPTIHIYGAGLAGSEAALQLAAHGIPVKLFDLKPAQRSAAHHSNDFAEIVCSNSLGNLGLTTASGLLKQELQTLDCALLKIAKACAVPAGNALAVDREAFSAAVTHQLTTHPLIECIPEQATALPEDSTQLCIVATGPLTTPALANDLARVTGGTQLFFFDAAAPIVTRESINMDVAFIQDRYGLERFEQSALAAGQSPERCALITGAYINCPLDKPQYLALRQFLLDAEKTPLKDFESQDVLPCAKSGEAQDGALKTNYFESCLPIEELARRGEDTMRYGPLKPVGLINPHTGQQAYAVIQLRQDNAAGTLYNLVGFQTNLKWGAQKTLMQLIPGLEAAEVIRYGVMHRNTYLHSPSVLRPTLQLNARPNVLVAGQLTGTEGYTESIATGLWAAHNALKLLHGQAPQTLPTETMLGALLAYITRPEAIGKNFQPINSNWGILPELEPPRPRGKAEKLQRYGARATQALETFINQANVKETPMPV
ncbi:MAG: methylenetetrahydrofolate--tRNA-(uracil(54)-C(5))-methyltransferase (FADH(2)-oxidizing) TrmFO [Vampirovibrionales bacterium]|nr:methylenetetrahydrofolate--tRNA-(uracil(54)-C(5))-methyltransferase (FADH(2)-oxidizing) TrmFO [Vampirovibrionales bacterium]